MAENFCGFFQILGLSRQGLRSQRHAGHWEETPITHGYWGPVRPRAMMEKGSLHYEFNSMFNIYNLGVTFSLTYRILYWCTLDMERAVHLSSMSPWFIERNKILINHLSSGYEIIFQVVQMSLSGKILSSIVGVGRNLALNVNLSSDTVLISASTGPQWLDSELWILALSAGHVCSQIFW